MARGLRRSPYSDDLLKGHHERAGPLLPRTLASITEILSFPPASLAASISAPAASSSVPASIRVLNGAAAGREVNLTKVVTTVGKPGVQVASITKRPGGYVFAHVEGAARPTVNGHPLTGETVQLKNGDVIELAGTQMQFVQL